jgi:hypothetical protein
VGEWIDREVSARDYLHWRLETAAMAYRYRSDDSRKPTSAQLVEAYADIERVAKNLLHRLQVGGDAGPSADNMPHALRFGAAAISSISMGT